LQYFEHPKPILRCRPFFFEAESFPTLLKHSRRGKENIKMSTKLYVGNISFNTSNQDLIELFSASGTVESANVIEDRETGRSRGFGFVEMASKADADAAIEALNGKEVDGRALKVNEAKPREERGGFGGGGGRGGRGGNRGGGGYGGGRDRW
jgi:RNA recognition motif-containing protein